MSGSKILGSKIRNEKTSAWAILFQKVKGYYLKCLWCDFEGDRSAMVLVPLDFVLGQLFLEVGPSYYRQSLSEWPMLVAVRCLYPSQNQVMSDRSSAGNRDTACFRCVPVDTGNLPCDFPGVGRAIKTFLVTKRSITPSFL